MAKTTMTSQAASRIQSATAKANGGQVPANSFAARAQSSAAKGNIAASSSTNTSNSK